MVVVVIVIVTVVVVIRFIYKVVYGCRRRRRRVAYAATGLRTRNRSTPDNLGHPGKLFFVRLYAARERNELGFSAITRLQRVFSLPPALSR